MSATSTVTYPIKPTTTNAIPMAYDAQTTPVLTRTSGMALASMICGIISLFTSLFGIVLGSIAITLGVMAKNKIRQNPHELKGNCEATAGIICGSVAVVIYGIIILFWVFIVATVAASSSASNSTTTYSD